MKPDSASLPPPLRTGTPGSFARRTIEQRKHAIIADLLAADLAPEAVRGLGLLDQEIAGGRFSDPWAQGGGPQLVPAERGAWRQALQPLFGAPWLDLPWYEAEASFYLRVLTATGYYDRSAAGYGRDPFGPLKGAELERNGPRLAAELAGAPLPVLLRSSLWGNRVDLSNYEIDRGHAGAVLAAAGRRDASDRRTADAELVIDHEDAALQRLRGARRVDFATDNAGAELVCDLVLADHLLDHGAGQVRLHVKDSPFFVSDATAADCHATLAMLSRQAGPAAAIGRRLGDALADGRLRVQPHWFWNGPRHYPDLPDDVRGTLAHADLVLFKGDVNYRRLLSDRRWPADAEMAAIVDYLPAPALVLRTLKSEIIAGLASGQAAALARADPEWLTNGRRGIMQLVLPPDRSRPAG